MITKRLPVDLMLIAVGVIINCLFWVSIAWLGASGVASVVKSGTGSCGTVYTVEPTLNGDFFCPDTGETDVGAKDED